MAIKKIRFILCFIFFFATLCANEYYVDINGSDNNPGTKEKPLKGIFKASELAKPGDTITIRKGEYKLQKQFRPLHSGNPGRWILYRAAQNETVVFDGALVTKAKRKQD
jgi:hypothetical protein